MCRTRQLRHRSVFLFCFLASFLSLESASYACPDLRPEGFTLTGPQIVAPGEQLRDRLFVFAHNIGTSTAAANNIAFYISSDATITTSDQLLIGGRDLRDDVIAGSIDPVRRIGSLGVPGSWPAGPAYLGVIVDEFNALAECNEFNNTAAIPVIVQAPANTVRTVPAPYATIAAAVTAATDGDTISILTGDYDESFTVDKDLIFTGAGWDSTVIRSSVNDTVIMDILPGASVIVRDIRFEGQLGEPYFVRRGIRAVNATVAISKCRFHTIVNHSVEVDSGTVSVDSCELLMYAGVSDLGVAPAWSIFWISDTYGGTRIDHVFDPAWTSLGVIEDCQADGSNVNWANGIRLRGSGPVALLRNNLIVGQHDTATTLTPTVGGIALFGPMFVEAHHNEIHGFVKGLSVSSGATVRAYRNKITDNIQVGVATAGNPALDLGGGDLNSPGLNTIKNNGAWSVRNESTPDLYAKYNWWGPGDSATLDSAMYDDEEDAAYGDVIFRPGAFIINPGILVHLITDLKFLFTFDSVLDTGLLVVIPMDTGPPIPRGLEVVPPEPILYHEIMNTAPYSGDIEVCYQYDEGLLPGPELALTLWHYDGGAWSNITGRHNPDADQVCGRTATFSPFIVGLLSFACGDVNASGDVTSADIIYMVGHVFKGGPEPVPVPAAGDANSDDRLTSADIIYLVNYVFKGGPAPECR